MNPATHIVPRDCVVFDAQNDDESASYGFVNTVDLGYTVWIFRLCVRPDCRRLGIATDLMRAVIEHFDGRRLSLLPDPFDGAPMNRDQLVAFYERFGFRWSGDVMVRDGGAA